MAKTFDLGNTLADVLKKVSDPDRGPEQIVLLPIASIDADANNFYSMDGVEELAANIELIGLLDPLRVRENPDMPGRYLIVSGHRRRAALWTLYESEPEKWAKAPCIVEPAAASPELQELRLIYANADTRRMSSADLSAQAERVEMLLYKLKEQGMEFPGRMRDHVAEACKVSATKLAVLKAIRNNLDPELFKIYEANKLNESAAYELQKLPLEAQKEIAASYKRSAFNVQSTDAEYCVQKAEKFMAPCKCDDGDDCDHHERRFVQVIRTPYAWMRCGGGCCLSCHYLDDCNQTCKKAKAKKDEDAKKRKAKNEKEKEKSAREEEKRQAIRRKVFQSEAKRLLPLIEKAGLADDARLSAGYYSSVSVSEVRQMAAGDFDKRSICYDGHLVPTQYNTLLEVADLLKCSTDYLLGRTDNLTPPADDRRLISVDDRYPDEGQYVIAYTRDFVAIPSVYFRAAFMDCEERSVANKRLTGIEYWSPRPQLPAGKKWPGQESIEEMVKK